MELSMHAAAAGVLGGAGFLADLAGLGPLTDLAVVAIAVDAVLARAGSHRPPRAVVVECVRAAGQLDSPPAELIGLICDVIEDRLSWRRATRLAGRYALDLVPVVGSAWRALGSVRSARQAADLVARLEVQAARLTPAPAPMAALAAA
jgi:hypothetical protein